jgi:hypothetical protein
MQGMDRIFYHRHSVEAERFDDDSSNWVRYMNLNEECLLQFLQNDIAPLQPDNSPACPGGTSLTTELKRILRHKHYVSFPQAILIRRPETSR